MYEQLWISLNVVLPMACLLGIGVLLHKTNVITPAEMKPVDRMNFRLFTPMLLFKNICTADMTVALNPRTAAFIVCALLFCFACAMIFPARMIKDRRKAASVAQAIVRTNYILLGITTGEAIYGAGNVGFIALYGVLIVPMLNILAVIVLELNLNGKARPGRLVLSVLKNPMIIAAICGLMISALHITLPSFLSSVVQSVASVATCISFLSLGVCMDLGELRRDRGPLTLGIVMRMLVLPLLILPCAILCGLRGVELCTVMILFASPVGVGTYPTAVAMGADGQLAGQLVYTTTILSVITIFLYTFLLGSFGLL